MGEVPGVVILVADVWQAGNQLFIKIQKYFSTLIWCCTIGTIFLDRVRFDIVIFLFTLEYLDLYHICGEECGVYYFKSKKALSIIY